MRYGGSNPSLTTYVRIITESLLKNLHIKKTNMLKQKYYYFGSKKSTRFLDWNNKINFKNIVRTNEWYTHIR